MSESAGACYCFGFTNSLRGTRRLICVARRVETREREGGRWRKNEVLFFRSVGNAGRKRGGKSEKWKKTPRDQHYYSSLSAERFPLTLPRSLSLSLLFSPLFCITLVSTSILPHRNCLDSTRRLAKYRAEELPFRTRTNVRSSTSSAAADAPRFGLALQAMDGQHRGPAREQSVSLILRCRREEIHGKSDSGKRAKAFD